MKQYKDECMQGGAETVREYFEDSAIALQYTGEGTIRVDP